MLTFAEKVSEFILILTMKVAVTSPADAFIEDYP